MTPLPLPRRAFAGALIAIALLLSPGAHAGQFKWIVGGDKSTKYDTYKDPAGRFEIEFPQKDWRLLPSGGSSLAVFSRKDGPALFIDSTRLADRLTPAEVDQLSDLEVSRLKSQQPKGKDFKAEMLEGKAGRGILIRYSRQDAEPESVVQYTIPVGQELFRLNGVVPEKMMQKNEPIIMHMIQSFKAPAGSAPTSKH
jgi:hypothetical protein